MRHTYGAYTLDGFQSHYFLRDIFRSGFKNYKDKCALVDSNFGIVTGMGRWSGGIEFGFEI